MLPKYHILFGLLFSYILIYFFNFSIISGIIIFLSSVLIDADHYFYFVFKKKNISLKNAFNFFTNIRKKYIALPKKEKRKYSTPIFIFHGIEFILILIFLSFVNKFFLWILIGVLFHLIFDLAELIYTKGIFLTKISQIYVMIRNKNKKSFKIK